MDADRGRIGPAVGDAMDVADARAHGIDGAFMQIVDAIQREAAVGRAAEPLDLLAATFRYYNSEIFN